MSVAVASQLAQLSGSRSSGPGHWRVLARPQLAGLETSPEGIPGSWHRSEVPKLHYLVEAILTYPSVLRTAQTKYSATTAHPIPDLRSHSVNPDPEQRRRRLPTNHQEHSEDSVVILPRTGFERLRQSSPGQMTRE
jgi:hypothetical protein